MEELILVGEVNVDRGGRVLDLLRYAAHGDALVALGDEEFPGRVENLVPRFRLLAFASFLDSHNDDPSVNDV